MKHAAGTSHMIPLKNYVLIAFVVPGSPWFKSPHR
jgi:hypothetical protein